MATPAAAPGLPPAALLLPQRAGRWRAAAALALLVLGWHVWLAGRLVPAAPPAGPPRPGLVQLRILPAAPPAAPAAPVPGLPMPAAGAAKAEAAQQPARPAEVQAVAAVPARAAEAAPSANPPAVPPVVPPATPPAKPTVAPAPADAAPAGLRAALAVGPSTDADPGPTGQPPPVYRTQLPPPAQLRYSLRLNALAGEALLVWQHDGQGYQLSLDGRTAGGAPLLHQASAGQVDAHGLAPDRYVDSRRGGRVQAANFRRDIGRIGYSGPPQQHPAWPGAQDRLSWLVQLAAILAAADAPPPDALRLFVTDARGHAGLWQLQRQPDATGPTPWGDALLQHWQREPPRPEALRVDVWLAAEPGTPAGAWPVRLRLQVPRSGDIVDLQLLPAP